MRFLVMTLSLLCMMPIIGYAQDTHTQTSVPRDTITVKMSMAPVVKKVTPAVVNIYTKHVVSQQVMPFFGNPLFQEFFRGGFALQTPERIENSLGSGVIVREDGLIVTNAHVAQNAVEIRAVLSDRREFPAELVLVDKKADLALLKIKSEQKFPALQFADSDKAEVGDIVLAVGNPFGVGQTVSSGIISALARTNVNKAGFGYYIQTDAAINPGNSGGALTDMDGRVLGINTVILSKTGGYMGIGFAVPSNLVRSVVEAYAQGGKLQRPWLGAQLQNVTGDIAASLGMERPTGVLVQNVFPNGPVARAGLKQGDLLLSIDGRPVDDAQTVHYVMATQRIGTDLPVIYRRQGKDKTTKLAMALPPETPKRQETTLTGNHPLSGATVANISPALAVEEEAENLPLQGVVLLKVDQISARVGLRRHDVVIAINGQAVSSVNDVEKAVSKGSTTGWQIQLLRAGQRLTLRIR